MGNGARAKFWCRGLAIVAWSALLSAAIAAGETTAIHRGTLDLIVPSVSVIVIWFVSIQSLPRGWQLANVAAATTTAVVATLIFGQAPAMTPWATAHLLAVGFLYPVVSRAVTHRLGLESDSGLGSRTRPVLKDMAASSITGALAATIRTVGGWLIEDQPLVSGYAVRCVRDAVAIAMATIVFGQFQRMYAEAGSLRAMLARMREDVFSPRGPGRLDQVLLLVFIGSLAYLSVVQATAAPTACLLLLPGVWLGARFPPTASLLYGIAGAGFLLAMTLESWGVFAYIHTDGLAVIFAHLMVAAMLVIPLLLSLTTADLREAVAKVNERNSILDLTLGSIKSQVIVADEHGNYLEANAAALATLDSNGHETDQVPDDGAYDLYLPEGTAIARDELPLLLAIRGEFVKAQEYHLRAPGKDTIIYEITTQELPRSSSRIPRRFVCLTDDVTQARRDNQALTSFAGVVAHDLNNPLTVVTAWAETILDELEYEGSLSKEVGTDMVQRIHHAALHMRNLISDLLAHATTRNRIPQLQRVELNEVVESVLSMQTAPLRTRQPQIMVKDLDPVWGDPIMVQQLIDNVIGNAVKYVEPGITPEITVTSAKRPNGFVQIQISDNGLGVPEAERALIFENFHRAHKAIGIAGTGLGLAICKQIVIAHRGSIVAESNPAYPHGQGSIFTIELPSTPEAFAAAVAQ